MDKRPRGRPRNDTDGDDDRASLTVKIVVMCPNIHTSAGKLIFRDQRQLPRDEVESVLAGDAAAGREPRFLEI